MLRHLALKYRIFGDPGNSARLGVITPPQQQPGGTATVTPGPGMGAGGFGSSGGGQTVTIGEVSATILSWTPSLITFIVPVQASYPLSMPLLVRTHTGEQAGGKSILTVFPAITGLSRTTSQPGVSLVITGSNFGAATGVVTIGGQGATVTAWSAASVTVTVPSVLTYPLTGQVVLETALGNFAVAVDNYTITVPNPVISHAQQPLGTNVSSAEALSTLEIIGTHFGTTQGTGTLKIHGHAATVSLWSEARVTVTVPTESSYPDGSGIILTTGGGLASNTLAFTTTVPLPHIASLNHASGQPGDSLTLTGLRFGASQGAGGVTIAGFAATVTAWADTAVTVTVPSAGSGSGSYPGAGTVVLTTAGALVSNGVAYTITVPNPALTLLSAATGQPGLALTLTGTFLGASGGSVTVDGTAASATAWADTSVTVTVPARGSYPDTGAVVLTTAGALVSNGLSFTTTVPSPVITSLSAATGQPGLALTLTGTDFGASQGAGGVTIDGVIATVTGWANLSVSVMVPARGSYPDTGAVVLTTAGALVSNGLSFTTTVPSPVITSLSAATGQPGLALTLTGTDFGASQGAGGVTIDGVIATVTGWANLSVSVMVPARGSYPDTGAVVLTTAGALTSNGATFTTTAPGGAVQFSGTVQDHCDITDAAFGQGGFDGFTVAFWVNLDSATGFPAALAGHYDTVVSVDQGWYLRVTSTPDISLYAFNNGFSGNNTTPVALSTGHWHLVVAGWDGQGHTNKLFVSIDGGAYTSTALTAGFIGTGTYPFVLGAERHNGAGNVVAAYASVGYWAHRLLSAGEVTTLWNGGAHLTFSGISGSLLTGLQAWYDCHDTGGQDLIDASGNGRTLLGQNGTSTYTAVAGPP